MSAAICAAVSARSYTRTSSIRPANHSPHTLLPPNRSGAADVATFPVCARVATWTPFT